MLVVAGSRRCASPAAWSNTVTLRTQGFGLKVVALPVPGVERAHSPACTRSSCVQEVCGLDVGTGAATAGRGAFVDLQK
jgi:hypothetical protein